MPEPVEPSSPRTVSTLDRLRIGLLVAGVLCVVTGLLPRAEAADNMRRIGPLLLFLGSVIVLAELTRRAKVFDRSASVVGHTSGQRV